MNVQNLPAPSVLLVESSFVLRRTIASVAAELGLASIDEVSSPEGARSKLQGGRYDALILGTGHAAAAFQLLADMRAGTLGNDDRTFALVLLNDLDANIFTELADITLRKPYKVASIFHAIGERPMLS